MLRKPLKLALGTSWQPCGLLAAFLEQIWCFGTLARGCRALNTGPAGQLAALRAASYVSRANLVLWDPRTWLQILLNHLDCTLIILDRSETVFIGIFTL